MRCLDLSNRPRTKRFGAVKHSVGALTIASIAHAPSKPIAKALQRANTPAIHLYSMTLTLYATALGVVPTAPAQTRTVTVAAADTQALQFTA
jgi:hypothetical protein